MKQTAIKAAKEAGKALLRYSKKEIKYTNKNNYDIQAEADLKAEKIILNIIKEKFPDHSILSEEKGEDLKKSDYLWIIDPLDGTINFSKGIEEFAVSIALQHKGDIVLGVIYQPTTGKMFVAEKGKGAFLNNKKITVSKETKIINSILATDSTSIPEIRKNNYGMLTKICNEVRHIRIMGSAALHLARVAIGNLDVYYKVTFNYWDFAAGALIIEEAGGKVTDFSGNKINKNSKNIIASNRKVHNQILKLLQQ